MTGSDSESPNWRARSASAVRSRRIACSRVATSADGSITRNSSGPYRPRVAPLGELGPQEVGHGQDRLVAGRVAVGVVEQPEVVDVDQGDRDRLALRAGLLDRLRQGLDQGAVVRDAGERVPAGRLDERVGLAVDPALGGAEDQVERDRARSGWPTGSR